MLLAILSILLLWQVAAWCLPDFLMPGVLPVLGRLWQELQTPEFRTGLWGSLTRLGGSYAAAMLFGIGFGLIGAVLFFFREVLKSAIIILQSIPSIAWVRLFLILIGFGNMPIMVVVALAAFFPAALSVLNATEQETSRYARPTLYVDIKITLLLKQTKRKRHVRTYQTHDGYADSISSARNGA